MQLTHRFLTDEDGQDLVEYTLLLSFVALASATFFIGGGGNLAGVWSTTNSRLITAKASAS